MLPQLRSQLALQPSLIVALILGFVAIGFMSCKNGKNN